MKEGEGSEWSPGWLKTLWGRYAFKGSRWGKSLWTNYVSLV